MLINLRQIRAQQWLLHGLFWLVIYLIYLSQFLFRDEHNLERHQFSIPERLLTSFFHLFPVMLISYFTCLRILPYFFLHRRILRGITELCVMIWLTAICSRIMIVHLLEPILKGNFGTPENIQYILLQQGTLFKHYIIPITSGALPFVVFYLLLDREYMLRKQAELEKERSHAQLTALKAQINPHFLFNTLNNIYSLAQFNSPLTPSAIEELSQLLSYLLYECNQPLVPLHKELQFINSYLSLNRIRFGDRLIVQYNEHTDAHYLIAPLLIIPIIENMVKHGLEKNTGTTQFIIQASSIGKRFTLTAQNNTEQNTIIKHTGIGLLNLQQQLELLYPNDHQLKIHSDTTMFSVYLNIPLT